MIDYKELLKKYMEHVVECEGTTFLLHAQVGGSSQFPTDFTKGELMELKRIAREKWGDDE